MSCIPATPFSRFILYGVIIQVLSVQILLCSCSNDIDRKMKIMMGNMVEIPSQLNRVWRDTVLISEDVPKPPFLVVHIDSADCSSCMIPKLNRFNGIFAESQRLGKYSLFVIVSPSQEEVLFVTNLVKGQRFIFPVFVDTENLFDKLNPHIPPDRRFHCFLTDDSRYPAMIGDPTSSDRLMDLFKVSVNSLSRRK